MPCDIKVTFYDAEGNPLIELYMKECEQTEYDFSEYIGKAAHGQCVEYIVAHAPVKDSWADLLASGTIASYNLIVLEAWNDIGPSGC